ncbi:cytochrome c oxidase, cbb3-type, CcoQ subunit [Campylobacter sp. RM9344]|uniref:Cytochrome c oxidase, cbb3-type, CcoQ subunit n=1 Tax=Campylobacter californiensis TaxID=1032243 RepID=A0AAW3ZWW5_9BACT|nr:MULTISPECIES: cytochrome c oxidase, cbb3-type, CcoQ subunit [unclassified Campylobacter]MBE2984521.1 cytochrome c oxidase, cbb3-type, CcoQ subunit [Campylobacter sp. RM6883]MBE2985861.1 cytochrome c oxidase, cbb3-type, CcoQ subunit [Campylobacter sp. RM12919]MBE2987976.1 cytochrome c oxidase, cbb3-type, CcoQ subunit [Campylobacter sp. RM12920]MBE2994949.1 cytochrome c oxidase, cbb3-type, CcoQ subunit [Campylobacter sp. RM6913]MBE3022963.1 cytochrome c oxidase, cbb3-type, CcoQ subunit [Campy
MDMQTIRELQAYGFFFFTVFLVLILYGYCYHLYKSEKTGRRNYEKYSNLALDDDPSSNVLEKKQE